VDGGRYRAAAVDEASLTEEERDLMARQRLDLEQIGYRRQIRADFRGLARQEYAEDEESCFLASGDSVFELAAIEARLATMTELVERAAATWRAGGVAAAAEGQGVPGGGGPGGGGSEGDYSAAQVLELETGLQCAEFAGHVGGLELARLVTELAAEYNQAWLVVERNNHGSGVLALIETVCGYGGIYRQGGQAGWLTTSLSRPAALGRLDAALVERPEQLSEPQAAGRVPELCAPAGWRMGARPGRGPGMAMALG
jgi:hypothetical protein